MAENDREMNIDVHERGETAEPDFDHLAGVVTDGLIGALGGLAGTAVLTFSLLIASTMGAFNFVSFASLTETTGIDVLVSLNDVAVGYLLFLGVGMVIWPLLFASLGSYLPGERYATKGISYGFVLWTGFAQIFYGEFGGLALGIYLVVTLIGHLGYGFSLGAVFDYFTNRPETLV